MKTIGFLISSKANEKRKALLPHDVLKIKNKNQLFFEKGYANNLGFSDQDYIDVKTNIACREEVLSKNVICDPKVGDASYLNKIKDGKTIFGWVHAIQNEKVRKIITNKKFSAIAWEKMKNNGRNIFFKNSELAGKAAVLHAIPLFKKLPEECKVAIIGRGNVAFGAYKILSALGADITIYKRTNEQYLKNDIHKFDIIVNAILWDPIRKDHLIYRENLKNMKKKSIIIDVSCDENGAIETSKPTSIDNPIFFVDGVMHYAVDHTPSLFPHQASKIISKTIKNFIDDIVEDKIQENKILKEALIIHKGIIIDRDIIDYQKNSRN